MSLFAVTERGFKAGRRYRDRLLCTDAFTISDANRQHQYVTPKFFRVLYIQPYVAWEVYYG